eukprot:UN0010
MRDPTADCSAGLRGLAVNDEHIKQGLRFVGAQDHKEPGRWPKGCTGFLYTIRHLKLDKSMPCTQDVWLPPSSLSMDSSPQSKRPASVCGATRTW